MGLPTGLRIAIVSKSGTVMNWAEDAQHDLEDAGHVVRLFATRHRYLPPMLNNLIYSDSLGTLRATLFISALNKFKPDLILAIGAYQLPPVILERISGIPNRVPFVGWVGNRFNETQARLAGYFDLIGYSDTGIINEHKNMNLTTECMLVPHAACTAGSNGGKRNNGMLFVGNPNPHRRAVLNAIRLPVDIYGPRWRLAPMASQHSVHCYRVPPSKVQDLYRSHSMTVNMKNDAFNIDGLNQRHFAPYTCGCAVVAEFMKDIELFFEKDKEIFCWSSLDELNELYAELLRAPARVESVAKAGQKRVLGEHLYRHRLGTIMRHIS